MCGISGYQGRIGGFPRDMLRHRGPDTSGAWEQGDIGLFHCRLSIIDLSESGRQPMHNEDRTLWLVFNGEIYNHQNLRKELEARGHRFSSRSDAEVILHGYEVWGENVLHRLRGMFAFALYDRSEGILFLARDPFGIKPLVYAELDGGFVFASELRVLATLPDFPRDLDPEGLTLYFRLNYIPHPWTIFQNARKLARTTHPDPLQRLINTYALFPWEEIPCTQKTASDPLEKILLRLFEEAENRELDGVNRVLYVDSQLVLPGDMLFKVDMASMRVALEVRVPFVDPVVARMAFSIPGKWKLRGLTRKWILRRLARKWLPEAVIRRPKGGFGIPLGEWMRTSLRSHLEDTLFSPEARKLGLNQRAIRRLLDEHRAMRRDRFWELWNLFVLVRWAQRWLP